jgi:hypothetical protein
MGQTALVKMYEKYFQDQFDQAMNKFETKRKKNNVALSVFEDFVKQKPINDE